MPGEVALASAAAIWARVEAGLPEMTPGIVAAHDEAYLRTLGLSQPKAHYARAIAEADLYFLDAIGLHQHLSPTRSNGLASMVKQMRLYAAALAARQA